MKIKNIIPEILRPLFHCTWIFTSLIFLLAYVPFTYRQVLSIDLLPWLNTLVIWLPAFLLVVTGGIVFSIFKIENTVDDVSPEDKREMIILSIFTLIAIIWQITLKMTNDVSSLVWSFLSLMPSVWLALFDIRTAPRLKPKLEPSWAIIMSGLIAGAITALALNFAYEGVVHVSTLLMVVSFSLVVSSVICLVEQLLLRFYFSIDKKFIGYGITLGMVIAFLFWSKVCAAIAFFGTEAMWWSIAFGGTIGLSLAGVAMRNMTHSEESSFLLFTRGIQPFSKSRWAGLLSWPVWIGLIYFVSQKIPSMDWNGLIQEMGVILILGMAFVQVNNLIKPTTLNLNRQKIISVVIALIAIAFIEGLFFQRKMIQSLAVVNPIFSLTKSLMFPAVANSDFYKFLQQHSNLDGQVVVQLAEKNLAEKSSEVAAKPHIFVFVIDSMRRDYLAPYNNKVTFTPAISELAKEALVFKNAFTRYGATGLSEPSIWAGRFLPHKMYPQPFSHINSIEKLIEAEGYQAWISRDSILKEILQTKEAQQDIDAHVSTQDLDICHTSQEILERFKDQQVDTSKPVFVYTQSQNIHVSVLARHETPITNLNADMYGKFNASYATALERVDKCLGEFIAGLKQQGLYEKSVLILTSDHGDSLGEEGRYGHAYTIFPEIMRIPLIVHLPENLKTQVQADLNRLVFSTDIAPSLEFILGRKPQPTHWSEGESFFKANGEDFAERLEKEYLVMSSYGPVAGIISGNGRSIYISDGVNFKDYIYEINDKGASSVDVSPSSKTENETLIKEKILDLYKYYNIRL